MSKASKGTREYELKFDVTEEQLCRLREKRVLTELSVAEPEVRTLRSVYYDTPNQSLRAKGISLRIRRIGDRWVQTLKTGRGVVAGLSSPLEFERTVSRAEPEVDQLAKSGISADCRKLLRNAALQPVFETIISRTTHQLHADDGSHIEIAFDKGVVTARGLQKEIHEVEIELKSGDPASVFAVAEKLCDGETLRFSTMTKADHGYRMVEGTGDGALAARRYHQPKLSRDCGLEDAYRALLRACAQQISHNWQVVLDGPEIDGPHQLRIGLRRLRSSLKAFRGALRGKRARQLETEARAIAAVAGDLRDIDVLATQIVPSVAEAVPKEAGLSKLQAQLTDMQDKVRKEVAAQLAGDRIMVFLLRLGRLVEDPKWRRKYKAANEIKAAGVAGDALETSWSGVEKWGRNIAHLSIRERHSMRKALKQLRYQTEAFDPFYPSRKTRPFISKLKNMQEIFGYLNDVAMAEKLAELGLADSSDRADIERAIAIVLGWHIGQSDRAWRKAKRSWKSLERTEKFWRT